MRSRVRELEARLLTAQHAVQCLAILLELAHLHAEAHRNREGIRCAREAVNIARIRGDAVSAARALTIATRCHHQKADFVAAVATGLEAVETFGELDRVGRSRALSAVATSLVAVEAFDIAEDLAERAAGDAFQGKDLHAEARARMVWGEILAQRSSHSDGRYQYRAAVAMFRQVGDLRNVKRSTLGIGNNYRTEGDECARRGENARARALWRQAARIYRVALAQGVDLYDDALAHAALAECRLRLDDPGAALQEARAAEELAAESRSPAAIARSHLGECLAQLALGRLDLARAACAVARGAAEQLDAESLLADCLKAETRLHHDDHLHVRELNQRFAAARAQREQSLSRLREEVVRVWTRPRDTGGGSLTLAW